VNYTYYFELKVVKTIVIRLADTFFYPSLILVLIQHYCCAIDVSNHLKLLPFILCNEPTTNHHHHIYRLINLIVVFNPIYFCLREIWSELTQTELLVGLVIRF